jgi:trans-2,3-dihydro-3-hydroxyanthranilate isomerase
MRQNQPEFGKTIKPEIMAEVLNIDIDDIDDRFPIIEVSTGAYIAIVPMKSLKAVKKARLNLEAYNKFMKDFKVEPIYFFSPETYFQENDLNVRLFAECFGIEEDPATGSAAGCLAGYLCEFGYFGGNEIDIKVEQGYEISRPSLLYLKAKKHSDSDIEVNVGGKVHLITKGELIL